MHNYTHMPDSAVTAEGEFDEAFKAPVVEAVAQLNLPRHKAYLAGPDCRDPPTYEEVNTALNDLATRLHKTPGLDKAYAWMVVLGGDAVHEALEALYGKVWTSGVLPDSWNEARVSYLHKTGSKAEVSNYRPISLILVLAKTFTKSWVGRLKDMVSRHMVKEQGCGQKGKGAPAHLWAFMDLVEEGMEGSPAAGDGAGAQPGACALCADVAIIMTKCGGMVSTSLCTPSECEVPCGTSSRSG